MAHDEYLDIIDVQDRVIGQALREEIYQSLHRHRIVHVLVFNKQGEVLLQKRSARNTFMPLHWGTSAGGHVQSGESYKQAGLRELREELGVTGQLKYLGKKPYDSEVEVGLRKFIAVFKTTAEGPFVLEKNEGEVVKFFTLAEIKKMLQKKEKFQPELIFVLQQFLNF